MKTMLTSVAFATAALIATTGSAFANDGKDRRIDLINDTTVTMTEFYASNIDRNSWEEDILDGDYLKPDNKFKIDIDDGTGYCLFDLKAVFADGDVVTENNFNVCKETNWTIVEE